MAVVNKLSDLSPAAQMELIQFLEPWFQAKIKGLSAAASAVTPDDLLDVRFNDENLVPDPRWLTVTANEDIPGNDASIHLESAGDVGDMELIAKGLFAVTAESVGINATGGPLGLVADGVVAISTGDEVEVNLAKNQSFVVITQPVLAITAVNTGAKRFTMAGDYTAVFPTGATLVVQGSTGNNGTYHVSSVSLSGGDTLLIVVEAVPSAVADGSVVPSALRMFECRDDGTVHILTGQTVLADL